MKTKQVTGPVMVLKNGAQTFQIWILNPGQWCQCTPAKCHYFKALSTGSIIYESFGCGMHECVEYPLDAGTIWNWIRDAMQERFNTLPVS